MRSSLSTVVMVAPAATAVLAEKAEKVELAVQTRLPPRGVARKAATVAMVVMPVMVAEAAAEPAVRATPCT